MLANTLTTVTVTECEAGARIAGGTPYYRASPSRLLAHLSEARSVLQAELGPAGGDVAYSVKTNYLTEFIRAAAVEGHPIEVVSENEYALVSSLGVGPERIIVNGPGKSLDFIVDASRAGSLVNLDSLEELMAVARWANGDGRELTFGLRIAARLSSGDMSRFGINIDHRPTRDAVRGLLADPRLTCTALHLHHSSRREADSFAERVSLLARAARELDLQTVTRLDIGGGFASDPPPEIAAQLSYPISTISECIAAAASQLRSSYPDAAARPQLLIEPGLGVLADTMDYVSRVVAVKHQGSQTALICDGSRFEVDPFRGSIAPPTSPVLPPPAESTNPGVEHSDAATIYGSTCMEIDQLGKLSSSLGVTVGTYLHTKNVGAYSLTLTPEFIFCRAPVVCADTGKLLRPRQAAGLFTGAGS